MRGLTLLIYYIFVLFWLPHISSSTALTFLLLISRESPLNRVHLWLIAFVFYMLSSILRFWILEIIFDGPMNRVIYTWRLGHIIFRIDLIQILI